MRIRLLGAACVAAFALAAYALVHSHNSIQASRVRSCQQTYQAFIEVFRPYFPSSRPDELAKFKRTVERLKARCSKQTS